MKAWKMVDLVHADAVARGSLRIGTLIGYATIENGRDDPLDGALRVTQGERHSTLVSTNPEDAALLGRFNRVRSRDGGVPYVTYIDATFEERSAPMWVFCMAKIGTTYDPKPEIPKAVFEIADCTALAQTVLDRNKHLFRRAGVHEVSYAPRLVDLADAQHLQADARVKDLRFAPEREIRLVFDPIGPERNLAAFTTDEDPDVAALLTRIS